MSLFSLLGALEIGLIFSLVALGVLISFRILNFPDLTVDGSFPMGGAVAATLIAGGHDPFVSTLCGTLAGAFAGFVTGWLNVRLKIMDLLASILMMIALYSVNLRIMGKPNVPLISEPTVFSLLQPEWMPDYVFRPVLLGVVVVLLHADWPVVACHRRQPAHGARPRRGYRPRHAGRHGAVQRAGRPCWCALRANARRR